MRSSRAAFTAFLQRIRRDPNTALADRFAPDDDAPSPVRAASTRRTLAYFLRGLRGHARALASILLTGSLATVFAMFLPALPKLALDYALLDPKQPGHFAHYLPPIEQPLERLCVFAALAIAGQILATVLSTIARGRLERLATLAELRMRRRAFAKTLRMPLHRIALNKTGGLVSIIRDEVSVFGDLTRLCFLGPFTSVLQAALTVLIVASIDPLLLFGPLALIPVLYVSHKTWTRRLRPFWVGARDARIANDGQATEALRGVRVVRTYRAESTETRRFTLGSHLVARQRMHGWWRGRLVGATWEVLGAIGSAAFFVYGGWRVLAGELTVGDLLWFLASLAALLRPAGMLVALGNELMRGLVRVERVMMLLEEPDDIPRSAGRSEVTTLAPALTLDRVSYRYPGSAVDAIDRVSVEIGAGKTVALVGPSGGGKSTLALLISRLVDPAEGVVRFGGTDLRELDVVAYRREIALVDQDTFVFDATIEENIQYGRRGASLAEVHAAGERAGMEAMVAGSPERWKRRVGEAGWGMSGGQRQRISIARAFLSSARVMIFDEATSQLDAETEADIQRALQSLRGSKTCVVIAHRLSTTRLADVIHVVEDGRILESGTHDVLLSRGGRYAALVKEQLHGMETVSTP